MLELKKSLKLAVSLFFENQHPMLILGGDALRLDRIDVVRHDCAAFSKSQGRDADATSEMKLTLNAKARRVYYAGDTQTEKQTNRNSPNQDLAINARQESYIMRTTVQFIFAPVSAFFAALALGKIVHEGDEIQLNVSKLTRLGYCEHDGEQFAIFSTDPGAGPINKVNVPDLPENVDVTEMFGAISAGDGNRVFGINKVASMVTKNVQNFFAEVVLVGYKRDEQFMAGSFTLTAILDKSEQVYLLARPDGMIQFIDPKITGLEIVDIVDNRVQIMAVKMDVDYGQRVVYLGLNQTMARLIGVDINLDKVPSFMVDAKTRLTQAPNGKLAIIDSDNMMMIYGPKAICLDTVQLPEGTLLAKVAIDKLGKSTPGFLTTVKRDGDHFLVDSEPAAQILGEGVVPSWNERHAMAAK